MTHQPPPPDPARQLPEIPTPLTVARPGRPLAHSDARSRTAPPATGGFSAQFLWRVFSKWWMWTLPIGVLLAAATGAAVYSVHVPKYEASALVLIESDRPFIAFEDRAGERNADRYVETQIELLQSSYVLARVIGRAEIAAIEELQAEVDPVKYLQQHLQVSQVGKSELYNVTYTGPSAEDSATIANVVVAEYLLMQDSDNKQRSQFVIQILEKERGDRAKRIDELRNKVLGLAKEVTGKDPFGQGGIMDPHRALSPISAIYQSSNEAEVDAEVLKAEIQALEKTPAVELDLAVQGGLLDLEISNRADVRELEAQIADIDAELKQRHTVIKTPASDSGYLRLAERSSQAKQELTNLRAALRKQMLAARFQKSKAEYHQLIATKMQELSSLEKKRSLLSAKLASEMKELKLGGRQSVELEFVKAELGARKASLS